MAVLQLGGGSDYGGSNAPTDSGYIHVFANGAAFAAIKEDGSISAWGDLTRGGTGAPADTGYATIYSTYGAFAAVKPDGSITAWGASNQGGTGAPTDNGYISVDAGYNAFSARKADGSITAWGSSFGGGSGAPSGAGFTDIVGSNFGLSALNADGSVTEWAGFGSEAAPGGTTFNSIYSANSSYAALANDSSVSAWGETNSGGSGAPSDTGYTAIYSNFAAFVAMKADGSIRSWGDATQGGTGSGAPIDAGYVSINGTDISSYSASCVRTLLFGLIEVAEDIAGNANATPVTALQLNDISGVSGALSDNEGSYTTGLQAGSYADALNPTATEVQVVVSAVNTTEATARVAEDIAGNSDGTAITAEQLNSIDGVSGVITSNQSAYTTALQAGTYANPASPTPAEIQVVIDAANAYPLALAAVIEDIAGNSDGVAATVEQINTVLGTAGAIAEHQLSYSAALQAGSFADPSAPTATEIQTVIDSSNTTLSLNSVAQFVAASSGTTPLSAALLNSISGVSAANEVYTTSYSAALQAGSYADASNPTAAEIQAIIDAVNVYQLALAAVIEDISGNSDGVAATADQINEALGETVALLVYEQNYAEALHAATFAYPSAPTIEEIRAVIVSVNNYQLALMAVIEDIAGNSDGVLATAAQINTVLGLEGAFEFYLQSYTAALQAGNYADATAPTRDEIQQQITAVNTELTLATVAQLVSSQGGGSMLSAAIINSIDGVSGAVDSNIDAYLTALQSASYANPALPTAAEIKNIIAEVNSRTPDTGGLIKPRGSSGGGALSSAADFALGFWVLLLVFIRFRSSATH